MQRTKKPRAVPLQTSLDVEIAYAQTAFPPWGFAVFGPVVDGDFFPASSSSLYRSGRFSKNIPMIAGWTATEAQDFVLGRPHIRTAGFQLESTAAATQMREW